MIRINLLPLKETQRAVGQRQQVSLALLTLSVAVLVMVIPGVLQSRKLSRLSEQMQGIEKEIARLNELTREAKDLDHKKQELLAKLRVIDDLNQKRVGPVHVLDGLSAAAPEKLWLVDFTENKGAASMIGMALDNQTIALFLRQLGQSPYFFNVDLVESSQSQPTGAGADPAAGGLKRFIIRANIDYFGRAGKTESAANGAAGKQP
ncbi:MAG: PilN domain-containing protein [Deltaproteobacteria bacterium]|nr:PilN domain-containing protein [Deltaproteobacteria bacterium]